VPEIMLWYSRFGSRQLVGDPAITRIQVLLYLYYNNRTVWLSVRIMSACDILRAAWAWHVIGPHDIYSALGMLRWDSQRAALARHSSQKRA